MPNSLIDGYVRTRQLYCIGLNNAIQYVFIIHSDQIYVRQCLIVSKYNFITPSRETHALTHVAYISLVWLHNITHDNNDTVVNPPN